MAAQDVAATMLRGPEILAKPYDSLPCPCWRLRLNIYTLYPVKKKLIG